MAIIKIIKPAAKKRTPKTALGIVCSLSAICAWADVDPDWAARRFSDSELSLVEYSRPLGAARFLVSGLEEPQSILSGVWNRRPRASRSPVCGDADLSRLAKLIYVSPEGSGSADCGATPASACRTVRRGIANCTGNGCGVLVRWGLYILRDTVQLADGVSLYGSCRFGGRTREAYRTVLQAPPQGKPAISARNINLATTLSGFVVLGSDGTHSGQPSIAVTVSSSSGLILSHTVLAAGRGADASEETAPSQAGSGEEGHPAYNDGPGAGGRACPSSGNRTATAGKGGEGGGLQTFSIKGCFLACVCNPINTGTGEAGSASGKTKGGGGGPAGGKGCGCTPAPGDNRVPDGNRGDPGAEGQCGSRGGLADANVWGSFSGTKWSPRSGGTGQGGEAGSGGGGGGAGGIAVLTRVGPARKFSGLPGGGGGGGGCGGRGGNGGQQGGASIPLVLDSSMLTLIESSLIPGPGGRGGRGGAGGSGGVGGKGGPGSAGHYRKIEQFGFCSAEVPGSGGPGGSGGQGGAGAGGAGGNGGPSIGIALVGGSPAPSSDAGIYSGQPGPPGSRGRGGQNASKKCKAADGADGVAGGKAAWHVF